jgi:energy-coupling factor transport system substrate-specific component
MSRSRLMGGLILGLASLIGLAAFVYPFFLSALPQSMSRANAHVEDAPLMTILLVTLCLGAVLATLNSGQMNTKIVAVLGMLTGVNAVLRAVPGPAGFAAVFALPVLCGYVYGATFGFLLGALSLLVSALIGGGVGPWLPYQMLAVGWVGLSSAWLPRLSAHPRLEVLALGAWGLLWGFAFGALMNIWFWPYVFQPQQAGLYWRPGLSLLEALRSYGLFYVVTSLWWDVGRAAGNALLLWAFGGPLLKLLRRFQRRFRFDLAPDIQ